MASVLATVADFDARSWKRVGRLLGLLMCPDGLVALTTADLLPLGGLVDATVDEEEVEGEEALDPTVFGPSTPSTMAASYSFNPNPNSSRASRPASSGKAIA